jgi:hypothetical protein
MRLAGALSPQETLSDKNNLSHEISIDAKLRSLRLRKSEDCSPINSHNVTPIHNNPKILNET